MTSGRGTTRNKQARKPGGGIVDEGFAGEFLALDLSGAGLGLFRRRAGGEWTELAVLPLQLGVIGPSLDQLYTRARGARSGPLEIEVWLPLDQVLTTPPPDVAPARLLPDREGATGAVLPLEIFAETAGFLAPHGFHVIRCTTREVPAGMDRAPIFDAPADTLAATAPAIVPRRTKGRALAGAVGLAAAAALVVAGVALGPRLLDQGVADAPVQSVRQIALAPGETLGMTLSTVSTPPAAPTDDPGQLALQTAGSTAPPVAEAGIGQPGAMVQGASLTPPGDDPRPQVPDAMERQAAAPRSAPAVPGEPDAIPALIAARPQTDVTVLSVLDGPNRDTDPPLLVAGEAGPRLAGPRLAGLAALPEVADRVALPNLAAVRTAPRIEGGLQVNAPKLAALPAASGQPGLRLPAKGGAAPAQDGKREALFAAPQRWAARFDNGLSIAATRSGPLPLAPGPIADPKRGLPALTDPAEQAQIRLAQIGTSSPPVAAPRSQPAAAADTAVQAPPVATDETAPPLQAATPADDALQDPVPSDVTVIAAPPDIRPPARPSAEAVAVIAARPDIVPPRRPGTGAPEPIAAEPESAAQVPDTGLDTGLDIGPVTDPATGQTAAEIPADESIAEAIAEAIRGTQPAAQQPVPAARLIAAIPDIVPPLRPRPEPAPSTASAADTPADPSAEPAATGVDASTLPADAAGDAPVQTGPPVTVIAALPDIIPPTRPVIAAASGTTPADTGAETLGTDSSGATSSGNEASGDVDALVVAAALEAGDLAASPNAIRQVRRPLRRSAEVAAAEAERVETLAALAPTERALERSELPPRRPNTLSVPTLARVSPTETETPATSIPQTQSAPAATARAAPQLPTSASVARSATIRNAMPMRQMVLIGVYGKSSNRHALLRLSSGQYQKVVPGDTIDGFEVAAISPDAIRLRKRGRDTLLVIPD